jgi:glucose-6-phosphate isomerase
VKDITIRNAIETDSNSIHELLMELAAFEKILDSVDATKESTNNALFGNEPSANAIVAIVEEKIVGAAIYFFNYSTFVGKRGLYL